ncbi:MAG: hypothetical protein ACTSU5_03970 [Promethearchaeota archaeon]
MPKVKFSSGAEAEVSGKVDLYSSIVRDVLIPEYKENNDWPGAIKLALKELKKVGKQHPEFSLDNKSRFELLDVVHDKLTGEIADLPGTDKIEILFLDLDDYLEEIESIMKSTQTPEEVRLHIASLVRGLTEFELGELVVELARKVDWNGGS